MENIVKMIVVDGGDIVFTLKKNKKINLGLIGKFYLRLKSKNKTTHWIKSTYVKLKINPK